MLPNMLFVTDRQQQTAAAQRVLPAGQPNVRRHNERPQLRVLKQLSAQEESSSKIWHRSSWEQK